MYQSFILRLIQVVYVISILRFSGVFPSVNAAIKRRDQALQVQNINMDFLGIV